MDNELLNMTISELAPRIERREISPLELVQAQLQRIDRFKEPVNSFITILADSALADARRAETEILRGEYKGPLHGIPFGAKDNLLTAGIRTTAGSKILWDWIPAEDTTAVVRMRRAGAVLMGKENLTEFAASPTGYNPHHGNIHNPWNLDYISGGSSGGSAANVASRQTFVSLGTDSGGSVRLPACLCGVVGLKATYGRVPLRGVLPPFGGSDHIGPITRSVRDAALALQVIAGYDDTDPTSVPVPVPDYSAALAEGVSGLVMGIPKNFYFDMVDDEVEAAVAHAIAKLEKIGIKSKPVELNMLGKSAGGANAESLVFHEKWMRTRPQDYDPQVYYRMLPGFFGTALDAAKGGRFRRLVQQDFLSVLKDVDFLVTPTIPIGAYRIGTPSVTIKGISVSVEGPGVPSRTLARYTAPSNQTGLPSLSVPCGATSQGMPIGLQFIGRPFDEETILRVGHRFEEVSEWPAAVPAGILQLLAPKAEQLV